MNDSSLITLLTSVIRDKANLDLPEYRLYIHALNVAIVDAVRPLPDPTKLTNYNTYLEMPYVMAKLTAIDYITGDPLGVEEAGIHMDWVKTLLDKIGLMPPIDIVIEQVKVNSVIYRNCKCKNIPKKKKKKALRTSKTP